MRSLVLTHGRRDSSVNRNRTCKNEAIALVADGLVDEVDAAQDIVGVIEAADEMRQPLSCVRCKVINVAEAIALKQRSYQVSVRDITLDKLNLDGDVSAESPRKIVKRDDLHSLRGQQGAG